MLLPVGPAYSVQNYVSACYFLPWLKTEVWIIYFFLHTISLDLPEVVSSAFGLISLFFIFVILSSKTFINIYSKLYSTPQIHSNDKDYINAISFYFDSLKK